ncbi:hypothetical protein QQS21_012902 [Conoideocrella luteorostrata]|uniref:Uncharacterized protein n=1 Tax=Conoideocrella luteorostrata TaxID=1105319 RepID=A0AAJ0CAM5_9HYPO|nr:hypothetical protein QQS21_012902 [Conoideocrella luteorostrata]
MTLKRKRSEPELCSSPSSSSSIFSSPPSNGMAEVNLLAFYNMPAAHLNSRTFKRFRDNKPSDEQVHQHTLSLLYSAQQQNQHQDTQRTPTEPPLHAAITAPAGKQQSLHRFWRINSDPTPIESPQAILKPIMTSSDCEDCGASLRASGGDSDMAMDNFAAENIVCGACGKHVCFSCSVSNLGEEKRCLQCAGRRVWVGGVGWANAGLPVC